MSEFTAEVIAIGDEMTSGARLDTNTQWLCQRLGELGVTVRFTAMVGDNLEDNVQVFRSAITRVDFVIATGGLGPTADDLTRQVLAEVANKPLVLHEPSLRHIESLFANRTREMPTRNRVQAMFPEGAAEVFNPNGTAPGLDITIPRPDGGDCRIFALPGVPAEMKEMFVDTVAPRIQTAIGNQQSLIRTAVIKCFGLGESEMEAKLGEMISRQSTPRVGITVSAATISLRVTASGQTEQECELVIEPTRREILAKAGEYVFGEGEDFELQDAVADLLARRGERVATIEVGHAAPLASWLAGTSQRQIYSGGRIYEEIGADDGLLVQWRQDLGADWLVVVDRYPSLRNMADALADVKITIVGETLEQSVSKSYRIGGHPSIIYPRIGKTALSLILKHILGQPEPRKPAT